MESIKTPLIVVDPGHGGYDLGASWQGRAEKDDNLRLGLAVQRLLLEQGLSVLMTRDTDEFISLQDRARMANEANASLFVALHRNSYIEQTPSTNGVENFIYLTAPENTAGRAASLVLDEVAAAGVQNNRGVKRGNYYVLRRTDMPSMLLEMGYIINDEDNRLFDEKLEDYAAAIVRGIMAYFNLPYQTGGTHTAVPLPAPAPPMPPVEPSLPGEPPMPEPMPMPTPDGTGGNALVRAGQQALNNRYVSGLSPDGIYGPASRRAATSALQQELNATLGTQLAVDGLFGPATKDAIPAMGLGARGNLVYLAQAMLALNGYNPGAIDGVYGNDTRLAVQMLQRDRYLVPDGIADSNTIASLIAG